MDAAVAALLGASVGFIGTIAAALVNPFTTAKKARETRLLELRHDAYIGALAVVTNVQKLDVNAMSELYFQMIPSMVRMRLVASEDIASIYNDLWEVVREFARSSVIGDVERDKLNENFNRLLHEFIDAARAHIGVD